MHHRVASFATLLLVGLFCAMPALAQQPAGQVERQQVPANRIAGGKPSDLVEGSPVCVGDEIRTGAAPWEMWHLSAICPSSGGGFAQRPIRPPINWRADNYLGAHPASSKVVYRLANLQEHAKIIEAQQGMPAEER